jgi:hypothetical protein
MTLRITLFPQSDPKNIINPTYSPRHELYGAILVIFVYSFILQGRHMSARFGLFSCFLLLLLTLLGCGGEKTSMPLSPIKGEGANVVIAGSGNTFTFEKNIKPIFEKNCMACHNGVVNKYIWIKAEVAQEKRDSIVDRLFITGNMPRGNPGSIKGRDKQLIEAWAKQGGGAAFKMNVEEEALPTKSAKAEVETKNDTLKENSSIVFIVKYEKKTKSYSYEKNIQPFFQEKCIFCHGAGKMNPNDWTDLQTAREKRDSIINRLFIVKNMPMGAGGSVQGEQKEIIEAWAKNNGEGEFQSVSQFIRIKDIILSSGKQEDISISTLIDQQFENQDSLDVQAYLIKELKSCDGMPPTGDPDNGDKLIQENEKFNQIFKLLEKNIIQNKKYNICF